MSEQPIDDIEARASMRSMGALAWNVYSGARDEGAPRLDATLVVYAWIKVVSEQKPSDEEDS